MKKIIFSGILFIALLCIYVLAAITLLDYNKIYSELASASKIDVKNIDELEYKIVYFPQPKLMIREIVDEKKIEVENITIELSLASILRFSPKVKSLGVGGVKIHINHDDVQLLSHDEFISELISRDALDIAIKVNRLEFVESDLDIPLVIEDFYFDGLVPDTRFAGQIKGLGHIKGFFKYNNDSSVDFDLTVDSKEFNAQIQESYINTLLDKGKVEIKAKNFAHKLGRLIPDLGQMAMKFNSSEEVNIGFDIEAVDSWMKFNNIKINSDSITGIGNIEMSKNPSNIDQINLRFSKIDLYSLKKAESDTSLVGSGFSSGNKFDFRQNRLNASVVIDEMRLTEKNTLTDVVLLADVNANKFLINRFTGNIDQDGKFVVTGEAEQNSFRSLFIGKIAVSHSDLNDLAEYIGGQEIRSAKPIPYVLSSELKLSSVDVSLQNIVVNTGNNELAGNMSIKFIGNFPRISGTLELDNLNMNENNFPVVKSVFEYAQDLTKGTSDDSYLQKFTPLRKLNSMSNLNIGINNLLIGDTNYDNFNFNMLLSSGRVKVSNLNIKDKDDFVDMNIDLQAQGIKPIVSIKINDGSVGVNFLSPSAMLDLRKKLLNELAIDKFDIVLNCYLSKVYQGDFELGRVVFLARTQDKLVEIQNFDADMFKGRMRSSGSILLEPYTLNFVYSLSSSHIREIADLLPPGYINTSGVISASGMWTSNGDNLRELLYNLYTRSTVLTKDITISNFSYDDLIEKASAQGYTLRGLRSDFKSALLTGITEISDLKTDVELSRGILTLPTIKFKTKYTSASANAAISIYNFTINLDSIFSFKIAADPMVGRSYTDYIPANIHLRATGNLFTPKKEGDISELEEIVKKRKN